MDQVVMPEITSPQVREVCESLMSQGHIEQALELARYVNEEEINPSPGDAHVNQRALTIKNLLVHFLAKTLEKESCNKDHLPCTLCVSQARKLADPLWISLDQFISQVENYGALSKFQLLGRLGKLLESDPVEWMSKRSESPLKIQKAPRVGSDYGG